MGDRPKYINQIREKKKSINLSDGVSREEAIIIAQNYLIDIEKDKICVLKSAEHFGENDPYWDQNGWHISFKLTAKERARNKLEWLAVVVDKKTGEAKIGSWGPS